jgi:predicted kinase
MPKPVLILVNGLPCTGKTTLARELAARLALPLFTKDQVKELLFDTLGWSDRAWSRQLGVASTTVLFSVVESELRAGRSLVAESNFHPELDGARVLALQERYDFATMQILCVADGPTLWARYQRRATGQERHPGHLDHILLDELRPQLLRGRVDPLPVGGAVREVDTTDLAAVDIDALAAWLRGGLEGLSPSKR